MIITTAAKPINIRPEVSVLSVFPYLNYKPWYAVAEFVDNAIQSFFTHRNELESIEGNGFKLVIHIELNAIDEGQLIIRDNAAGIHEAEYGRAFKTAAIPADRSGLSEFGIGMKSAACWFAKHWSVRTSAVGEDIERYVSFDVATIVHKGIEELTPIEVPAQHNAHYTEIVLHSLHSVPQGKTVTKIKDHLASIYRIFIEEGILELWFKDEKLDYIQPTILTASYFKDETEEVKLWHKHIDLNFGKGLRVHGFAALRETASISGAGFALFRRNRLIQGSGDEGYRPEQIFKKANSFTYQRLFGELHVEGFEVSHTKDGIRWAEHEDIFLEFLKEELNKQPLPLIEQAEGYRVRPKPVDLKKGAEKAIDSTATVIKRDAPAVLGPQIKAIHDDSPPPIDLPPADLVTQRVIDFILNKNRWRVIIELSTDPSVGEWLSIADNKPTQQQDEEGDTFRQLTIRLSLAHPFMDRFAGSDSDQIEPLLRIAAALALAEITAREGGVRMAGTIRRHVNDLLRNVLSKA